jgi:Ca-activated chloride channel homolog
VQASERFGMDGRGGKSHPFRGRCLTVLFFLVVSPGVVMPQERSTRQGGRSDPSPYTFSVGVDMVVLHASVTNRKGMLVSGLDRDSFQVYEDGVLQRITHFSREDIPVTVGLVVDNSGSMRTKRPGVIAAVSAFVSSSKEEDEMFAVSFNENVSFGLPADQPFTDKQGDLEAALSAIAADGMTALYDALAAAIEHLKHGNREKQVLLVVSDGEDNASQHTLAQVMAMAGQPGAIIYTIGLFESGDVDRNPRVLRRLARATGGEAFFPKSGRSVIPICEQIARDIRNQYTIVYSSTNQERDGTYRAIQVRAGDQHRERMLVRTRAGYFAPLEPRPSPPGGATENEIRN